MTELEDIESVWMTVYYSHDDHTLKNPFGATWTVRLRGDRADLVHLPGRFTSGPVRVAVDSLDYFLYLAELEDVVDLNEARNRVGRTMESINGAMTLLVPGYKVIEVYSLETQVGEKSFAVSNRAGQMTIVREPALVTGPALGDTASRLVSLAGSDAAVADVLRFLGKGRPDAATLFKIYEIISDDVGGDGAIVKELKWTSSTELRRFTSSMNNRKVLGDSARHATERFSPPKNPMSLDEANGFMRRLMISWLQTKHQL